MSRLNEMLSSGFIDLEAHAKAIEDLERRKLAASKEWRDGAIRAVRDYLSETNDAARAAERVVSSSLRASEDAFVKFATTGKASISDLFNTLAEEVLRASFRMAVVKPFGGFLESVISSIGSGLGGLFGSGGGGAEVISAHTARRILVVSSATMS